MNLYRYLPATFLQMGLLPQSSGRIIEYPNWESLEIYLIIKRIICFQKADF